MTDYRGARALFDAIVAEARKRDAIPEQGRFDDCVTIAVSKGRAGQLAIDDVGPEGSPNYRLTWVITLHVTSGNARIPDPLDLTEDDADVAVEQIFSTV